MCVPILHFDVTNEINPYSPRSSVMFCFCRGEAFSVGFGSYARSRSGGCGVLSLTQYIKTMLSALTFQEHASGEPRPGIYPIIVIQGIIVLQEDTHIL